MSIARPIRPAREADTGALAGPGVREAISHVPHIVLRGGMTMQRKSQRLSISIVALLAVGLLAAAVPAFAEECQSTIEVRLESEQSQAGSTHLQFGVDVRTREECAKIIYDLILEIQLADGQVQKVRKMREVKLNDGGLTEMVRHEMPYGARVVNYETKLVKCETCNI